MTGTAPYDDRFYRELDRTAEVSARHILPLLLALAPIASIVDVGCGDGGWLAAARDHGIDDILGLDGPWIEPALLKIPLERFRRVALDQPFAVERRFDVAVSLEVAEHLPPERAAGFVGALTGLAPLVLFSAAIPGQGGVVHLNEQWPAYWARLFAARGYRAVDALRQPLWAEPAIAYWYKQNLLLFAAPEAFARYPALAATPTGPAEPIALVHPDLFAFVNRQAQPRVGRWLKMAPQVLRRTWQRRRRG